MFRTMKESGGGRINDLLENSNFRFKALADGTVGKKYTNLSLNSLMSLRNLGLPRYIEKGVELHDYKDGQSVPQPLLSENFYIQEMCPLEYGCRILTQRN